MANPSPSNMALSDIDRMMEMINGFWITQIVYAAATYSLADHLAKGPATATEIAEMADTDPSATFRLLRACASLGLVTYDGECRFTATSLLNTLRTDYPRWTRKFISVTNCLGESLLKFSTPLPIPLGSGSMGST
jgi:Dimerisation domain